MRVESFITHSAKIKVVYMDCNSFSSGFLMHNYSSLIEGQKQGQVLSVMVVENTDAAVLIHPLLDQLLFPPTPGKFNNKTDLVSFSFCLYSSFFFSRPLVSVPVFPLLPTMAPKQMQINPWTCRESINISWLHIAGTDPGMQSLFWNSQGIVKWGLPHLSQFVLPSWPGEG